MCPFVARMLLLISTVCLNWGWAHSQQAVGSGGQQQQDIAVNCANLASRCEDNTYRQLMLMCCRGTCQTLNPQSQNNCADKRGDLCPIWNARRRDPFCISTFYSQPYKAYWCARTCNLCAENAQLEQQAQALGVVGQVVPVSCQQLLQNGWPVVPTGNNNQPQGVNIGGVGPNPPGLITNVVSQTQQPVTAPVTGVGRK